MRYGAVIYPAVRFGAVFRYRKSYGAVRCCDISYGAVRSGSPLNGIFYGTAPLSVWKTVQYRFFSAVHRMNKPYGFVRFSRCCSEHERNRRFSAVSLRCTVLKKRANPRVRTVFCCFFTSRQSHQQQQVLGELKTDSIINRFVHAYHPLKKVKFP